jgi:DNA replication factor GINS
MVEETITFELIRRIQREEQKSPKLTKMPENFYQNVNSYLQQKRKLIEKEEKKIGVETKNVERLIEDIYNRRERKILNLALIFVRTSIQPENLTDGERVFFDQLTEVITKRRVDILSSTFELKPAQKTVIFKEDIPQFIGSDLKEYGPFKKGDDAEIPLENAKILIEKGIAEEK